LKGKKKRHAKVLAGKRVRNSRYARRWRVVRRRKGKRSVAWKLEQCTEFTEAYKENSPWNAEPGGQKAKTKEKEE